jgi:sterol desaturase/sphingolipid hydroxylase (fatty acid hydroxylase superfamily)
VIFVSVYLITCWAIAITKQYFPRIQKRECPREIVRRDIKQSLFTMLFPNAMLFAGGEYLQVSGIGFSAPKLTPTNLALMFFVAMLAFDTWYYWSHRLSHLMAPFRAAHRWHHHAITPVQWSVESITFIDNIGTHSFYAVIYFFLPMHPTALLLFKIYQFIGSTLGHSGHEYLAILRFTPRITATVLFHDQHHEIGTCNFAPHFTLWDRFMGTLHPQYDERLAELIEGWTKLRRIAQ